MRRREDGISELPILIFCVDVHMRLDLLPPSTCVHLSLTPPPPCGRHNCMAPMWSTLPLDVLHKPVLSILCRRLLSPLNFHPLSGSSPRKRFTLSICFCISIVLLFCHPCHKCLFY